MTKTLERALARVSRLSARDQVTIARRLLAVHESETRWSKAFRRSADRLVELASEALGEHRSGKTRRHRWDRLPR